MPWQSSREPNAQRHDEPTPDIERTHYFSPSRFYCVETVTAPCGVVPIFGNVRTDHVYTSTWMTSLIFFYIFAYFTSMFHL
jgi:hypothetical protein